MTFDESADRSTQIPHDRLFKELLSTFLVEFLQLFLPDLAALIDPETVMMVDKELFPQEEPERRVDLVAEVRTRRGEQATFLVHVEHEAQNKAPAEFPWRMLQYTLHLYRRSGLAVYPIALLSYPRPRRPLASRLEIHCPEFRTLTFRYQVIQLNRMEWRDFVQRPNPVAAALMSRMRIAQGERPLVKLACLRMLAGLRLGQEARELISRFFDIYLPLDREEQEKFLAEFGKISKQEKSTMMELTTSWERIGMEKERKRHEIERQQLEMERQQAEMERQQAEMERQQAEMERQQAEMERQQAEERAQQERERAEQAEQELARVKAELEALRRERLPG